MSKKSRSGSRRERGELRNDVRLARLRLRDARQHGLEHERREQPGLRAGGTWQMEHMFT